MAEVRETDDCTESAAGSRGPWWGDGPIGTMNGVSRPARSELLRRRRQTGAFQDLARITRSMDRNVEAMFVEAGIRDITPAQANALMVLFEARHPMTARRLAAALSLSEVTVGRFLRALETNGWVERRRDPDDSRAILASPTQGAHELLPRFIHVSNTIMDQAFAGLDDAERESLFVAIRRVRENLSPDPA